MTPAQKLKNAILELVDIPIQVRYAKIKSIDKIECTCSVLIKDVEFPNVLLSPIKGNNGLMMYPKIGSIVLIALIENTDKSFVTMYSEVDLFEFNKGQNGGLAIVKKIEKNLDSLKNYVESMNRALPTAFSAIGVGTAANGTTASTNYTGSMIGKTISFENMENTKIKH